MAGKEGLVCFSTLWFLEFELRALGSMASVFTCWVILVAPENFYCMQEAILHWVDPKFCGLPWY